MRFLSLFRRNILKELYEMAVTFEALSVAVDNAVAKLAAAHVLQAELDQAKADLVAAQAKVDELAAKLA